MAGLGEIVEELRTDQGNNWGRDDERNPTRQGSTKRKRSRNRRNSGSQGSDPPSPSSKVREEVRKENESGGQNIRQQANDRRQDILPIQEDHQARFYADYRKVADEYDKEFLKKYDEDLNTTLIFAGLFSAVTSAFIIQVDSQLKPDPGDETAALLRVLIYEINNTRFGDNVPTIPQWRGPPPTMVHVQSILFASLVVSLLSAFLAMLGKQWLNRYASTDIRGSAVERSHNRQRKLDGIVKWYFDHVMESLPLMLQAALLLLGCALSRYLWDTSITVASVVVGVTSLGFAFYVFIIVAGAVSDSCPYQTPVSRILHHLGPKVWSIIAPSVIYSVLNSVLQNALERSLVFKLVMVVEVTDDSHPWWSRRETVPFLGTLVLAALSDIYHFAQAVIWVLFTLPAGVYRLVRGANSRLCSIWKLRLETAPPNLRCISWTLQTSLDKPVHLTALEHLGTVTEFTGLDPVLVVDCFNVFVGCVSFNNRKPVILRGLEQLASASIRCVLHILHHLLVTNPTSSAMTDLCRNFNTVFPDSVDYKDFPLNSMIVMIRVLIRRDRRYGHSHWDNYRPPSQEHIPFARYMADAAREGYQKPQLTLSRAVPHWILHFALQSLSLDPPPPASVIADCLTIIAIDMDCDVSNSATPDESARVDQVSGLITQKLKIMAEVPRMRTSLESMCRAIDALVPYAIRLEQGGQQDMINVILLIARVSVLIFRSDPILPHIAAVFDKSSPSSLDRVITIISPYVPWSYPVMQTGGTVARWAAAASAVPYSEEVGQSVADALLQISFHNSLRSDIPINLWAWLKKRPPLSPMRWRQLNGSPDSAVHHVRTLGDIEILKSYLLLIWSEWNHLGFYSYRAIHTLIGEDFDGIGMRCHRDDLIKRLDHVLGQLGRGLEYFKQHEPKIDEEHIQQRKGQYERLKNVLLEVDNTSRKL